MARKKDGPPETACVYLGAERLARLQARASELKYKNFSAFVSAMMDAGLELSPEQVDRLKATAILKGKTLPALLAEIVDKATKSPR